MERSIQGCCFYHLRGWSCASEGRVCGGAHVAKEARPACDRWLHWARTGNPCPFGEACFFPHVLPPSLRELHAGVCGALQTCATHAARLQAYVEGLLPPFVAVTAARAHGASKRSDVCLLLQTRDAGAGSFDVRMFLQDLCARPFLRSAIIRAFVLSAAFQSEAEATAYLLQGVATATPQPPRVRLQCFPRTLEVHLAAAPQLEGVQLHRQGFTHLFCLLLVGGVYYCGLEGGESPCAPHSPASGSGDAPAVVCRAELKLQECIDRVPGLFSPRAGGCQWALDVGASPGGWTSCLLSHPSLRFSRVFAVDPGELDEAKLGRVASAAPFVGGEFAQGPGEAPAAPAAPRTWTHLRVTGLEAVEMMLDAVGAAGEGAPGGAAAGGGRSTAGGGGKLAAFVCDANIPTVLALEALEQGRCSQQPRSLLH
jgi:hypothetical protein